MRAIVILVAAALTFACTKEDVIAFTASDAGAVSAPDGGASEDFCNGSGPPIIVGDQQNGGACGGTIARRNFRFALCTCEDYVSSDTLAIDAFDSRRGGYQPGATTGGSLGVNGRMASEAAVSLGGSLFAGHTLGVHAGMSADLRIRGELQDEGPLDSQARVEVGLDARVGGLVRARDLDVTGTLFLPIGANIEVSGTNQAGAVTRGSIDVAPPCGCAASDRVDIAGYVAAHAGDNDNATIQLDAEVLADHDGAIRLALPCGRFYLSRIGGRGEITLAITGRTALFIGGDASLDALLKAELSAAAELDLFIGGNLVSSNPLELGSATEPARVRIYIGGSGTIQLSGGGTFAGNLYAPSAELVTSGPLEAFGSVFVRRISASGSLTLHYDDAILSGGGDCPAPQPSTCNNCLDCGNAACMGGTCGACAVDADCCAPLVCRQGTCTPEF